MRAAKYARPAATAAVPKMVGRSSGATTAGKMWFPAGQGRGRAASTAAAPANVGRSRMMMNKLRNTTPRQKMMMGGAAAVGLGGAALSRNTGRAMDPQRGRPTGVYQY